MSVGLSQFDSVYVAGHRGMVGSALLRQFEQSSGIRVLTRTSSELDLRNQSAVTQFFEAEKPELVIVAAAKVGGIVANSSYPAQFLSDNLQIATNTIDAARKSGAKRLLFLGSSCIYPKHAPQPISETDLLTGPLEPTNEAYAIAKIAGLKLCEFYRQQYGALFHSAMPCNLYGPGDNYHPENSHVIPGLIRRFHEAKLSGADSVCLWGTGKPLREFLHVDDLAAACVQLCEMENPPDLVNVGAGVDIAIRDLATLIAETTGFEGEITTDPSKPDGTPQKLMDSSVMQSLGWTAKIELREGLNSAYSDFLATQC